MTPDFSGIILGALAGLLIISIIAIFSRPRPLLLAATLVALGAFVGSAIEAHTELNRCRRLLAEYRSPPGPGPDVYLKDLIIMEAIREKLLLACVVLCLIATAGLIVQSTGSFRARRALRKSQIANP